MILGHSGTTTTTTTDDSTGLLADARSDLPIEAKLYTADLKGFAENQHPFTLASA